MEQHEEDNAPMTRKMLVHTLGEFTEQVLLPAVQRIVHEEVSKEVVQSEHRLKVWVDERLADLRADIVLLTRKEDRKVLKIVDLLREKNILNDSEVQEILHMEPFAAQ